MKAKVERLRMGLVAGTLLLLVVVAGTFGYSRYRAAKRWLDQAKKRSGVSLERETDGFTYSQSMQGRTVFTLHAAKAFQHAGGLWTLHDVVLTLYGLGDGKSDRADRIYGNQFEWDENKGVARAVGEVQMDLQVPAGIAASERHSAAAPGSAAAGDAQSIHVRTSGLVFLRQLGVAATDEAIEFHYGGLTCMARGAEFDSNPSALHLLADVRASGAMRGEPMKLLAARADFDRTSNLLELLQPEVEDRQGKARAAKAVAHLRRDGSVETVEATGDVVMDEGTRHVSAARLDTVLNERNQAQTAKFSGGVKLVDDDVRKPSQGDAGEVLLRFDAAGKPAEVDARGGAHVRSRVSAEGGTVLHREMSAREMVAELATDGRGKAELRQVHATGGAMMRGESVAQPVAGAGAPKTAGIKTSSVAGDDLLMRFVAQGQRLRMESLHGRGHTVLQQTAPLGEEHTSSGDALEAVFGPMDGGQLTVMNAVQQGHVTMVSRGATKPAAKGKPEAVTTGTAERASYDGATERLTLSGEAHLVEGETSVSAASVIVDQRTGDAEAQGNVVGTLAGKEAQSTHVSASHAVMHHATQTAEFMAGDGRPARLWQQASQVEAGTITMDRTRKVLTARPAVAGGTVHSVFAGAGTAAKGASSLPAAGRTPGVLRVESSGMEYADDARKATFTGPVRIDGAMGDVKSQRADVFFAPATKGALDGSAAGGVLPAGGLERVVVSGAVRVEQPGRLGTGEQLVYKAVDGSFVLTGTTQVAPRVVDAQQGTVTGESLLFRSGDSTIEVAGAAAGAQATGGKQPRARIETRVRQKSE